MALFDKTTDLKAPDDYILDTNDELNISVWGFSNYNASVKVSPEGYISNPELGRIYVRGMSFGAVKGLIRSRLASFVNLSNSRLEVAVSYSRSISVNIVGEVSIPGTYRIPAINSVYNAINAAEGITPIGSVRNIEVRRSGKTIKKFDLYDFLMNGNVERDFFLQDGDFIYVPAASKIVAIDGSIRRPKQYELLPNENLPELVNIAGGLPPMPTRLPYNYPVLLPTEKRSSILTWQRYWKAGSRSRFLMATVSPFPGYRPLLIIMWPLKAL